MKKARKVFTGFLTLIMCMVMCVPAFATEVVTGDESESLEYHKGFAYLDLDEATPEVKEKILKARKELIYNTDWVADGYTGYIQDVETGEIIKRLPQFSEVFPGWDNPVEKITFVDEAHTHEITESESANLSPLGIGYGPDDWVRIVNSNVYLEAASATENAEYFVKITVDPFDIGTYIRAYATALSSSETCNIGISDYDSGQSLALGTRLTLNQAITLFVGTRRPVVAVRASTYSKPGSAKIAVDGAYRVMHVR